MSLFDALGELCTMPIRCLGEIVNDVTGEGDEDVSQPLAFMTLGGSSIVKGIGKTIQKAVDKLD